MSARAISHVGFIFDASLGSNQSRLASKPAGKLSDSLVSVTYQCEE